MKKLKGRTYRYDIEKDYGAEQYLIWNIIKDVSSEQEWIEVEEGLIYRNHPRVQGEDH